jgi:hypothetical protein
MIILTTALCLLNIGYSQDYKGVDANFFSSVQALLNNAKGQKTELDNTFGNKILGEQVFTSTAVSVSIKQGGGVTYTKYAEMDWMEVASPDDYTYRTSVDDNPKLMKLRLTFNPFSSFKRYYYFKGNSEGDFSETTYVEVYFLEKDEYALLDILNSYKIYTRSY